MGYIKQLDSLRAIAILFVLCNHWFPTDTLFYKSSKIISAPDIFFTISGFLITMILLKDRNKSEANQEGKTKVFIDFFVKRGLRIYPAYYLTILITYLLKPDSVSNYGNYLTFTANFDMYQHKYWGYLAHLWSMSVEQQFYLFWPLLILFIPKRFLLPTITSFIMIGVVCQNIIPDKEFLWILPQTCFDALGLGALLAWIRVEKQQWFPIFYKTSRLLGIVSIALVAGQYIWGEIPFIHHRSLVSVIVVWLIGFFITEGNEGKGKLSFIFHNRAFLLIGKMSYGIYLYHITSLAHSSPALHYLNYYLPIPQALKENHYFFLFEHLLVLLTVAWLSWKYFELPVSNLKKHLKRENPLPVLQKTL